MNRFSWNIRTVERLKTWGELPTVLEESREYASISMKETLAGRCQYLAADYTYTLSPQPLMRERERDLHSGSGQLPDSEPPIPNDRDCAINGRSHTAVGRRVQKSPGLFSGHHLGEEYVGMAAPFDMA